MTLKSYIGDRAFYRRILAITLPIIVQNGISTFVNLLDNIMVGSLGTEAMAGVSVVNQFLFIYELLVFGGVSAAGIFMAQYHGLSDEEGERHTFRLKFLICLVAGALGVAVLAVFRNELISLFLTSTAEGVDPAATLVEGNSYLLIMLAGLLPFAASNVYASSMRETGDTMTPMIASIASVATNFVFNSLLIFGLLGLPRLGVRGAAIATVIARVVELLILVIHTHRHPEKYPYARRAFRSLFVPGILVRETFRRGLPLMLNELFWAISVIFINRCYSTKSLAVVPALNIYTTLWNVLSIAFLALGNAIAIVIGNELGAGELEKAKDTDKKLVAFSLFCGIVTGALLAALSGVFPLIYNTTDEVRDLAAYMLRIAALAAPFSAFTNASYFTIRSGGQVLVTVLFDSVFQWTLLAPTVFLLASFTPLDVFALFAIGQGVESLKAVLGGILLRRGGWVRQLVRGE